MSINFPVLDKKISFEDTNILVVESRELFSKLSQCLYMFDEQEYLKIFDESYKKLKSSNFLWISDIYSFDINSAQILKSIYASIEYNLNEKLDVKTRVEKLASEITNILSYEFLEQDLDLEYDEITILELIKVLGVKVEVCTDSPLDRLFEIMKVYKFISRKQLLIFQNIGVYFSKKEIESILEYARLSNINLLVLEARKLYDFKQYVLDEDYFLTLSE
ncbi:type II-A CRISPR-associated protein Csn2 [Gemella sp. GL1.1]|nr:type II-A CRISPR-associated protein Csn2 [Gemella sp. GL1.1]MBF0746846.1 type II-A CRISPR-associated protein Csn2 [Gemella sp. 19428wG2_WT2a]NYS27193.1 type II-A CRISPR-associated protein Csn2 [Gemella sp. GL1]TFU59596.1 type II-A CRISPR-associated protein Csn2 [Gemella sp. WT2a]